MEQAEGKTACVVGATGLVGSALLDQLIHDPAYSRVLAFTRRATGKAAPKLEEHIIDFADRAAWESRVRGDVLFSALGTTKAQAGSLAAQRIVDYGYQLSFAQAAAANKVQTYVLVSSGGASASSLFPYLKMKGELERDVSQLPFSFVHIVRPGLLCGERAQPRSAEKYAAPVLSAFSRIGFSSLRPVTGPEVAGVLRSYAALPHAPVKTVVIHEAANIVALIDKNAAASVAQR